MHMRSNGRFRHRYDQAIKHNLWRTYNCRPPRLGLVCYYIFVTRDDTENMCFSYPDGLLETLPIVRFPFAFLGAAVCTHTTRHECYWKIMSSTTGCTLWRSLKRLLNRYTYSICISCTSIYTLKTRRWNFSKKKKSNLKQVATLNAIYPTHTFVYNIWRRLTRKYVLFD